MNDPTVKNQVGVRHFSLDLHGGDPDYVMLTRHSNKGPRYRVAIPVELVPEITEALQSLVT